MVKVLKITNKYLKEKVKDEFIFLPADKHQMFLNPIPGRGGYFGPPPISIRDNFFLVEAMNLKFSVASQLLIRKILPKCF